ncbi:MAG: hypothetical protein L0211_25675 [Planctomycetaceae bacterium]|nr:hypothetical protein [Planctomycetaceae bacterium]
MNFFENCVLRLHDGVLEGYTRREGNVVLTIHKWDETVIELTVHDVVYLQEQMGEDDLEGFFEVRSSAVLDQAIGRLKAMHWPDSDISEFTHFQLLNLAALPVLEIVGKRWSMQSKNR